MFDAIASRTISAFPLSVGTSLAMESVFEGSLPPIDPARNPPSKVNINDYHAVYVNVGTLFRNMYNAIDKNALQYLRASEMGDALGVEIDVISDAIKQHSNGLVKVYFYMASYQDLQKRYPRGARREPRTHLQLMYSKLYTNTMVLMGRRGRTPGGVPLFSIDSKFSNPGKKCLLISHFAVDLLNWRHFKQLDLLESHTGALKMRHEWYTKYYDGRDLNMLPLNGILLTVFGDDHTFRPQTQGMKRSLLETAKARRWNCLSTPQEIIAGIKSMRDHALRDALLEQEPY
jgi:hypothetical protein